MYVCGLGSLIFKSYKIYRNGHTISWQLRNDFFHSFSCFVSFLFGFNKDAGVLWSFEPYEMRKALQKICGALCSPTSLWRHQTLKNRQIHNLHRTLLKYTMVHFVSLRAYACHIFSEMLENVKSMWCHIPMQHQCSRTKDRSYDLEQ